MCGCRNAHGACDALLSTRGSEPAPRSPRSPFSDAWPAQDGKKIAEEITALGGGRVVFVKCDVSKQADLENLIEVTLKEFGQIDCLINNA